MIDKDIRNRIRRFKLIFKIVFTRLVLNIEHISAIVMRYGNVYYAYNIIDRKMYVIYCKYIACTMYNIVYCLVNVQDRFYYGYRGD